MGEVRKISAHRKALGIAVAVLFPASFAVAQAVTSDNPSTKATKASSGGDQSLHQAAINSRVRPPSGSVMAIPSLPSAKKDNHSRRMAVVDESSEQRVSDVSSNTHFDIPEAALRAYRSAARTVATSNPSCHLSWGIIAAIGQVESNHGRYGGASVLADGTTSPRIVGLPLNGVGAVASIPDSDGGRLDGDTVWDRAVGPMQFIPTSWAGMGADGDGDGVENPSDFDDAALATAQYLCSGGGDMRVLSQARSAVYRYNHSDSYVDLVLSLAKSYDSGVVDVVPNDPTPAGHSDPLDSPRPHHPTSDEPRPHHPKPHHPQPEQPTPDQPKPHHPKPHHPKPDPIPGPKPGPAPAPPKPAPQPGTPPPAPTEPAPPAPTTPDPTPEPTPTPPPPTEPPPEPTPTELEGIVAEPSDGVWTIGDTVLDFGEADLTQTQADYDGDGAPEAVELELEGLTGRQVTATLDSNLIVITLNFLPVAQDPAPSSAPATTAVPTTSAPASEKPAS